MWRDLIGSKISDSRTVISMCPQILVLKRLCFLILLENESKSLPSQSTDDLPEYTEIL